MSKFLKNRCVAAAKKRDYVEPTSPCQAFRESFLRRPGKHPNDPTPKPSTASPLPASLRLRSSTAALEEVRIIDTQTLRSSTKNGKNTDALMRETSPPVRAPLRFGGTRGASRERQRVSPFRRLSSDRGPRGFAPAGAPAGTAALKSAVTTGANAARGRRSAPVQRQRHRPSLGALDAAGDCEQGERKLEPPRASDNASVTVAARPGLVLSSARHAGENSSMESPKAQPPEPLRQKDRVRSKSLESGTGARRRRIHRRGTPSSAVTSHTYMSADATRSRENLSGKRTDGACSVTNRTRPFLVHPDGAPSR